MKTSNKLLLVLFCLILASLFIFNYLIKKEISIQDHLHSFNQEVNQKALLKLHTQFIGNSLYIDSTMVILSIDKNSTAFDLKNYQTKLKEVNIDLKLEKTEYNSIGKIKFLSMNVDCNDGFQGWCSIDFAQNGKIGFFRNYAKDSKNHFAMNPLDFKVQHSSGSPKTYVSISYN